MVLPPNPNSAAGAIAVHSGGRRLLLDKPYAAAGVESAGRVRAFNCDSADTPAEFGAAISALPGRPAAFTFYFHDGTDAWTVSSEAEIARVFREIEARPDSEIFVIGHTDAVGTDYYNDQLSLQRAQRVRSEIVNRGILDGRIVVSGRGKGEPLLVTGQGVPEPTNHRVEINVR